MNVLSLPQPTPTLCTTRTMEYHYLDGQLNCPPTDTGPMVQWIVPLDQPAPPEAIGTRIALAARDTTPTGGYSTGIKPSGRIGETDWVIDGWGGEYRLGSMTNPDIAIPLPLGAIVGSATIQTCLPIVDYETWWDMEPGDGSTIAIIGDQLRLSDPEDGSTDVSDQLPYGDYRPGRYAWILSDAAPCTERCPSCWGDGVTGEQSYERISNEGGIWHNVVCPACDGAGRCEPIPWTPPNPQQLTQWTPT